jgi:hypothetical protein
MTSTRRIFVLLFTLLPLLAAQCWGLCGVPASQRAMHQNVPPCHKAPTEPAQSAPAPCCTVNATFDVADNNTHDFTPDPAITQLLPGIEQLVLVAEPVQNFVVAIPPSPPARHLVLRV